MSNKVYGFCDAGCRYHVPSYDEFVKSVYKAEDEVKSDDNGLSTYYYLKQGVTARIQNERASTGWGFSAKFKCTYYNELYGGEAYVTTSAIELPAFDKYSLGVTFKLHDCYYEDGALKFIYDMDGVRCEYSHALSGATVTSIRSFSMYFTGLTRCWRINEDAKMEVETSLSDEDKAEIIEEVKTAGFYTSDEVDTLIANAITTTLNTEV